MDDEKTKTPSTLEWRGSKYWETEASTCFAAFTESAGWGIFAPPPVSCGQKTFQFQTLYDAFRLPYLPHHHETFCGQQNLTAFYNWRMFFSLGTPGLEAVWADSKISPPLSSLEFDAAGAESSVAFHKSWQSWNHFTALHIEQRSRVFHHSLDHCILYKNLLII